MVLLQVSFSPLPWGAQIYSKDKAPCCLASLPHLAATAGNATRLEAGGGWQRAQSWPLARTDRLWTDWWHGSARTNARERTGAGAVRRRACVRVSRTVTVRYLLRWLTLSDPRKCSLCRAGPYKANVVCSIYLLYAILTHLLGGRAGLRAPTAETQRFAEF